MPIEEKIKNEIRYIESCRTIEVLNEERTLIADISTDAIDRYDTILVPSGVRLENYLKNPIVLWAHNDARPPIAKALWVRVMPRTIRAKLKFAQTELANEVWMLYREGFLNAFSAGFIPLKWHEPTFEEIQNRPELKEVKVIYDEWELVELSTCCIPANPEALAVAVAERKITLKNPDLRKKLKLDSQENAHEEPKKDQTGDREIGDSAEYEERLYICVSDLLPADEKSLPPIELEIPSVRINGRLIRL